MRDMKFSENFTPQFEFLTTLKDRNYLNSKMKKLLAIFNENENS
jgi:hypothetical protein